MPPEAITQKTVKQLLRALTRGEHTVASFPAVLLPPGMHAAAERTRHIRRYLKELIQTQLVELRHKARGSEKPQGPNSIPPDDPVARADVEAALAFDFAWADTGLEAWSALYHRYLCDVDLPVEALAAAAHVSERHFRRRVEAGIALLTDQLREAELAAAGRQRRLHLDRYLTSPDYLYLVGIQEQTAAVIRLLIDQAGPAIVALEGLGGIGKTTLAQAVALQLAERGPFAAILWVSAQQHRFLSGTGMLETLPEPALTFAELLLQLSRQLGDETLLTADPDARETTLQARLHATPHLIIMDNLETMTDYRALAPRLHRMLGPSRALITSRHSLSEYGFVQSFPVPPLSTQDSLMLVRNELARARRRAMPSDDELIELCALAGGLPLALKLIAGLLNHGVPLPYIRHDLQRASGAAYTLYTYIYRRTWLLLSEAARQLLIEMLLVAPDGEDMDWIIAASNLSADVLREALTQLLDHCLVQITGTLQRPFYRLHPLTVLFLKSDVVSGWEADQIE